MVFCFLLVSFSAAVSVARSHLEFTNSTAFHVKFPSRLPLLRVEQSYLGELPRAPGASTENGKPVRMHEGQLLEVQDEGHLRVSDPSDDAKDLASDAADKKAEAVKFKLMLYMIASTCFFTFVLCSACALYCYKDRIFGAVTGAGAGVGAGAKNKAKAGAKAAAAGAKAAGKAASAGAKSAAKKSKAAAKAAAAKWDEYGGGEKANAAKKKFGSGAASAASFAKGFKSPV